MYFAKKHYGAFRLGALFWIGIFVFVVLGTHFYRKYKIHGGMDPVEFARLQAAEKENAPALMGEPAEWKVLALVYNRVSFDYIDQYGQEQHFRSAMTPAEVSRIEPAFKRFFLDELPIMTNNRVRASIKIKHLSRALTNLSDGCGLYPGQDTTKDDIEADFDSVVVFWDSSGVNALNGKLLNPHPRCGGFTPDVGINATYTTITIDGLSANNHNVIKHEWGHSILFYFNALGKSPRPMVSNHINSLDKVYVNCKTGLGYELVDETYDKPVPNSIYNIYKGFTRDYYLGETATQDRPTRCLGIPPSAWQYSPTAIFKKL